MAGMLPWMFFSAGLADSANSLLANTNLVSKVYFPRLILPSATIVVAAVDFLIGLVVLAAMMAWYGFVPGRQVIFLPIFILMAMLAALGPGLWITAVNVRYRDFRFVIPFIVQFGLYVSPVGFAFSVVPEEWRLLYALNPMVGVINGFRWSLLGGESPLYIESVIVSSGVILLMLWVGFTQFRRLERSFADLI
jgi:lipopolysaccharide transport system permease protein